MKTGKKMWRMQWRIFRRI